MPDRIQLRRTAGWRKPGGARVVTRATIYGNPWAIGKLGPLGRIAPDAESAVGLFVAMLSGPQMRAAVGYPSDDAIRAELRGRDLACWCAPGCPCHADVLLALANTQPDPVQPGGAAVATLVEVRG